jgi:hypothetical protein
MVSKKPGKHTSGAEAHAVLFAFYAGVKTPAYQFLNYAEAKADSEIA